MNDKSQRRVKQIRFRSIYTSSKHIYQTLQTKKRTLKNRQVNKFSKTTIALSPVQSPSSLSTFLLFIPYFHFLIGYFYGSLRMVAAPIVRILINFVTLSSFNQESLNQRYSRPIKRALAAVILSRCFSDV